MSAAILVMGCYHPLCLNAALDFYHAAGATVYVHVDAKRDIDLYKSSLDRHRPTFLKTRQSIFWGGFNMIRAEMDLISLALESPENHQKFILVSDDTLPVTTIKRFIEALAEPFERAWMSDKNEHEDYNQRYREFYFLDSLATCMLVRDLETSYFDKSTMSKIQEMAALMERGKRSITPYHGSQWWSISRQAAESVLRSYENDDHLRTSFEFSAVPDEMFVQSVLGNAGYLNKIRNSLVHVEWHNRRPRVYSDPVELPNSVADEIEFIRKIDSSSTRLLDFFKAKWSLGEPVLSP